jgi:hypothetical protein
MEALNRRILTLLNATGESAIDKVVEEAGIPYSCPAQHHHSHHNSDAGSKL